MSILLDGKKAAQEILQEIEQEVLTLSSQPKLVVVLVGENPASQTYVRSKARACKKVGFASETILLPETVSQEALLAQIMQLNADATVHGILVQLPLPSHIDEQMIIENIVPEKDVDGFHPQNLGKLLIGLPGFKPCTPYGMQELLRHYQIQTRGKHCVVVGRSNIVGKPFAAMMLQKDSFANATVTVCHSATENLTEICRSADILVAAIGRPHFITAEMVREGAVIIDVGINSIEDPEAKKGYRIVGDVDFENVAPRASFITPVPGGVGQMTIAMLMKNTLHAYYLQQKEQK